MVLRALLINVAMTVCEKSSICPLAAQENVKPLQHISWRFSSVGMCNKKAKPTMPVTALCVHSWYALNSLKSMLTRQRPAWLALPLSCPLEILQHGNHIHAALVPLLSTYFTTSKKMHLQLWNKSFEGATCSMQLGGSEWQKGRHSGCPASQPPMAALHQGPFGGGQQ